MKEERYCPFRKSTYNRYNGEQLTEYFEDCYGKECMLYYEGRCALGNYMATEIAPVKRDFYNKLP